ncbi:unnamed protein product [Ilex paraguariensis]|uniref:Uncharacterized protein n=1 Tax=Ilex paraguariensis TaxID=185542 RepID=A0ABC8TGL8_9AQUA
MTRPNSLLFTFFPKAFCEQTLASNRSPHCEYRIKKLRNEDNIMRKIRNRRKAQERWDKLRKYVRYTWGCSSVDDDYSNAIKGASCSGVMINSFHSNGSSFKQRKQKRMDDIHFIRKVNLPSEKKATPECIHNGRINHCLAKSASNLEGSLSCSTGEPVRRDQRLVISVFAIGLGSGVISSYKKLRPQASEIQYFHSCDVQVWESKNFFDAKDGKQEHTVVLHNGDVCQARASLAADDFTLPPPPSLEFKADSEIRMADLQKHLQSLYEYNVMLREKLIATQSLLHALTRRASSSAVESQTVAQ